MDFVQLVEYCRAEGRICPAPQTWNKFWQLLPDRERSGSGWRPALPLILAAWHATSDDQKRERFIEHLAWARDHGILQVASDFLTALSDAEWHCADRPW